jgi:hypothetical protein
MLYDTQLIPMSGVPPSWAVWLTYQSRVPIDLAWHFHELDSSDSMLLSRSSKQFMLNASYCYCFLNR